MYITLIKSSKPIFKINERIWLKVEYIYTKLSITRIRLSKHSVINILPVYKHERYRHLPNYESEIIPHLVFCSRIIASAILHEILFGIVDFYNVEQWQGRFNGLKNLIGSLAQNSCSKFDWSKDYDLFVTDDDLRIIFQIFIVDQFDYSIMISKLDLHRIRWRIKIIELTYPKFNYNDFNNLPDHLKFAGMIILLRKIDQDILIINILFYIELVYKQCFPNDMDIFLNNKTNYNQFLENLLNKLFK